MKKVRYLAGAVGLAPAAVVAAVPTAAQAASTAPGAHQKVVALHDASATPRAGCHGNKEFHFSTANNPRLRGHGWYRTVTPDAVYCVGTVVISMKYNKSLSKAAYVRINPGDPFNSSAKTTGLKWEPKGTWLHHSFAFQRNFVGMAVGLNLFSFPYGDRHGSWDHATITGP